MYTNMLRWFVLALAPAVASCADWRALYAVAPADAAAIDPSDAAEEDSGALPFEPDVGAPVDADAGPAGDAVAACPFSPDPIVLWRFAGSGPPDPMQFVPDYACRAPDVSLGWDLLRKSGKTNMSAGALFLDGGFLFAGIKESDDVGRMVTRAHSFTVEIWLQAKRGEMATIFGTDGEHDDGRAFALIQKDTVLQFAVRTTVTDPNGEKFTAMGATPGGPAEVMVPVPVDNGAPVQVVAIYSVATRAATVYVGGVLAGTVVHARPPVPAPTPVWTTGKNQLGLGGSFQATAWHGWLYRVSFYDRAIEPSEVQALFAAGLATH
jgi:hypothetical protein